MLGSDEAVVMVQTEVEMVGMEVDATMVDTVRGAGMMTTMTEGIAGTGRLPLVRWIGTESGGRPLGMTGTIQGDDHVKPEIETKKNKTKKTKATRSGGRFSESQGTAKSGLKIEVRCDC
eukprot:c6441_g1_i1.p2 GENE.c6441_g1_i1~~c6441_g1_i1.p2  ORF type:complete len:119 (+),score=8.05 c6441_g1_i1:382-738(+)